MKHILFILLLCGLVQACDEHNNPAKTTALLTAGYLYKEQQKNVVDKDRFTELANLDAWIKLLNELLDRVEYKKE